MAQVTVSGGQEQHIKVELNRDEMNQYGLDMNSIAQYMKASDFTIPLGSVDQGSQSISVISTADTDTAVSYTHLDVYKRQAYEADGNLNK